MAIAPAADCGPSEGHSFSLLQMSSWINRCLPWRRRASSLEILWSLLPNPSAQHR